jgi:ribosome modulation factor
MNTEFPPPTDNKKRDRELRANEQKSANGIKKGTGAKIPPTSTVNQPESFVGMWADRQEMRESTLWVRELRANEQKSANGWHNKEGVQRVYKNIFLY